MPEPPTLVPRSLDADATAGGDVGRSLLRERGCHECHGNAEAPHLAAVFGAAIASQSDVAYSRALRAVDGTWDRALLARFLADTQSFAPGTTMPQSSLTAAEIEVIVDELEAASGR